MIEDIRSEYRRYRDLGEKALAQMPDVALNHLPNAEGNSAAMIVRHIGGNFVSRFTDFLTADGEKPDRDRDREFEERGYSRAEMDATWTKGWAVLEKTLAGLTDADFTRTVTIRGQPLTVSAALCRSLAHVAYHVGQLVLLARMNADKPWQSLSIPRGASAAYNAAPSREKHPGRSS